MTGLFLWVVEGVGGLKWLAASDGFEDDLYTVKNFFGGFGQPPRFLLCIKLVFFNSALYGVEKPTLARCGTVPHSTVQWFFDFKNRKPQNIYRVRGDVVTFFDLRF